MLHVCLICEAESQHELEEHLLEISKGRVGWGEEGG
jgi:hypothetical protein